VDEEALRLGAKQALCLVVAVTGAGASPPSTTLILWRVWWRTTRTSDRSRIIQLHRLLNWTPREEGAEEALVAPSEVSGEDGHGVGVEVDRESSRKCSRTLNKVVIMGGV